MPTVLRSGPYRLFFFAGDREEPMHVPIEREDRLAKFWLDPIRLQRNDGFRRQELVRIAKMIEKHRDEIVEFWHDYFGN